MRQPLTRGWGVATLCLVMATHALATDIQWNNSSGGAFSQASNWSPASVPNSSDVAIWNKNSTGYSVNFTSLAPTSSRLVIRNDVVTFTETGSGGYTLTSALSTAPGVTVGDVAGDHATLTLAGVNLTASRSSVGFNAGAVGKVTVGFGANWSTSGEFRVGESGSGEVVVDRGGIVFNSFGRIGDNAGSIGTVTVDGSLTSANALRVGRAGAGSLRVEAGGRVASGSGFIATDAGSTGQVVVTGAGSGWTIDSALYVAGSSTGAGGAGTLTVETGAAVDVGSSVQVWNQGAVQVNGGTFTVDSEGIAGSTGVWTLGQQGSGSMTIGAGGSATGSQATLGALAGATGSATIDGAGAKWSLSGALTVGKAGSGTLTAQNGGVLSSAGSQVGGDAGSGGSVVVAGSGSKWTESGALKVGSGGSGSLAVQSAGVATSATGVVGEQVGSSGLATIEGVNSKWTVAGALAVGQSGAGELQVQNGGQVSSGASRVGTNLGANGLATVTGTNSKWTASSLTVGADSAAPAATGTVAVLTGGRLEVAGATTITSSGAFNLSGGTFVTQSLTSNGAFNWTTGTLQVQGASGLHVSSSGPFYGALTLSAGKSLSVSNALAIDSGSVLSITGGTLSAGGLTLDNGLVFASSGLNVNTVGGLQGRGSVMGKISGSSSIVAAGPLTLGDLSSTVGFDFSGTLNVGANQVVLLDADRANLGTQTTLAAGGTLNAINGAELTSGETLTATGSALVTGKFKNNGMVKGPNATGSYLTLNDDVSGIGGYTGNILFAQNFRPGNSPGDVHFFDNLHLAPGSVLEIEIGGMIAGVQHDIVRVDGDLTLNAALDVKMLNGYRPHPGDEFTVLTFDERLGDFVSLNGLDLGNGLSLTPIWEPNQLILQTVFVPEPTGGALAILGAAGVWAARRRSKKAPRAAPFPYLSR